MGLWNKLMKKIHHDEDGLGGDGFGARLSAVDEGVDGRGVSLAFLEEFAMLVEDGQLGQDVALVALENGRTGRLIEEDKDRLTVFVANHGSQGKIVTVDADRAHMKRRNQWTIRDIEQYVICPLKLKKRKATYTKVVESQQPEMLGRRFEGTFVAVSKDVVFSELVASLLFRFKKCEWGSTFVWLECFGASFHSYHHHQHQTLKTRQLSLESISRRFDEYLLCFTSLDEMKHIDKSEHMLGLYTMLELEHERVGCVLVSPDQRNALETVVLKDIQELVDMFPVERNKRQGAIHFYLETWFANFAMEIVQTRIELGKIDSLEFADLLHNTATLFRNVDQIDEATALYKESLSIRSSLVGDEDLLVGETLNCLGELAHLRSEHVQALQYFKKALIIFEMHLGSKHSKTIGVMNTIAAIMGTHGHGKLQEAMKMLEHFEEDHSIRSSTSGQRRHSAIVFTEEEPPRKSSFISKMMNRRSSV